MSIYVLLPLSTSLWTPELLGVKRQEVVPLALLSMDYWSHVIAAEELNHPTKIGIVDVPVVLD